MNNHSDLYFLYTSKIRTWSVIEAVGQESVGNGEFSGARLGSEVVRKTICRYAFIPKIEVIMCLSIVQENAAELRYTFRFYIEELRFHLKNGNFLTKAKVA